MACLQARAVVALACLVCTTSAIGWHARVAPPSQKGDLSGAPAATLKLAAEHPSTEGGGGTDADAHKEHASEEGEHHSEHKEHHEGDAHAHHEHEEHGSEPHEEHAEAVAEHGEHHEHGEHSEHEAEHGSEHHGEHSEHGGEEEHEGGEHGHHEEHGEGHGEGAGEGEHELKHGSVLMAIGMFCNIALLSMVIGLVSSSNKTISSHAWYVVDQVILIFLAVMTYQAFAATSHAHIGSGEGKIFAAALQTFALFMFAFFLSWHLRSHPVSLAIFCGGGAHFIAFASCHMAEMIGEEYAGEEHLWRKLGLFIVLALFFAAFSAAVFFLKKHAKMDTEGRSGADAEAIEQWNDQITDTENDFIAMALAVVWTTFIFHAIMEKDHSLEVEPEEADRIEKHEELMVLGYAVITIPVAVVANKLLATQEQSGGMLVKRLMMFVSSFAAMASCWAFLFMGQMHFYSHFCFNRPLFCRIVFSMLASVVAAVAIVVSAQIVDRQPGESFARTVAVTLTAFSLAAAWSWEQCFDAALEGIAEHFEHRVHHLKLWMTLATLGIIMPTYVYYVKPIADKKTSCLEG